ncbi:MAG: GNAT family N-acetyltransferase [Flavisolibacter sp.]
MNNLQFREALLSDVPSMAKIRETEWGSESYWQQRITAYINGTAHPQHSLPNRILYLAEDGTEVVGFIAGHLTTRFGCSGELQWINVLPAYRGHSVAIRLLCLLSQWFVAQQAQKVCVDVDPSNERARRFYRKMGAEELNEHWMVWKDIGKVIRTNVFIR